LGFSEASATVRLVCAGSKAVYDALVMRLVLRWQTTDEAVGMLVLRFPAVVSLGGQGRHLGRVDVGGAASSEHPPSALVSHFPLLRQRDGSWCAGAPQHHRRP
jgi:hypothetical protein